MVTFSVIFLIFFQVTFYEEERDILAKATSAWITHLQYAFQVRTSSTKLLCIIEHHLINLHNLDGSYKFIHHGVLSSG